VEIERKYLLKGLPDIKPITHAEIFQGYISTNPEVRIRSYEVLYGENKGYKDYKLTIKGNGDLSRDKIETYISQEFFKKAAHFIKKQLIQKDYREYIVDGRILECTIVDPGKPTEFCYAEVEFNTEKEAREYQYQLGTSVDVTYDKSYKMKEYWLRTRQ